MQSFKCIGEKAGNQLSTHISQKLEKMSKLSYIQSMTCLEHSKYYLSVSYYYHYYLTQQGKIGAKNATWFTGTYQDLYTEIWA